MGATSYQRLSEAPDVPEGRHRRGGGGARAWAAAMRRAAAGIARLYASRRRWAAASGDLAVRARARARARGRGRHGKVAPGCGYDSEGYARNFDDGVWKAEEGVFWSAAGPSLAACRLARSVSAVK